MGYAMDKIIEKIENDIVLKQITPFLKDVEAYLVGGYIRDLLLGKESFDRDIVLVCDNIETFTKNIADRINATFIELDRKWGIYRLVLEDKKNYVDFARAVENDIEKDILRRDLTINAVAYNLNTKEFYDPTNGICAIKNKKIEGISEQNFIDDPLRLLRAFRFQSSLGFEMNEITFEQVKRHKNLILEPAKERVNVELMKLFEGENTADTLKKMDSCAFLSLIFPFVEELKKIPKNTHHHLDLFNHSIETVYQVEKLFGNIPFEAQELLNTVPYGTVKRIAYLKLGAFLHDIGKPKTWTIDEITKRHRFIRHDSVGAEIVSPILKELKFSKKQISYIKTLIRYHIYPSNVNLNNEKSVMKFLRKLEDITVDIILLAMSDRMSARGVDITDEVIEENINHLNVLLKRYFESLEQIKPLPKLVDGNEIMKILNIKPSPILGKVVAMLRVAQEDGEINTKDEAVAYIKNIVLDNLN